MTKATTVQMPEQAKIERLRAAATDLAKAQAELWAAREIERLRARATASATALRDMLARQR